MDDYDNDLDAEVNDIISQIKNHGKKINLPDVEKEYPELTPDQVDSFVLKYASRVIIDLAEVLTEQSILAKTGTSQEIVALSELARAFQGNVEVLQKRKIADNKNTSQKEIKQMDIDSRPANLLLLDNPDNQTVFTASREEMLKALAQSIIEAKKIERLPDPNPPIDV